MEAVKALIFCNSNLGGASYCSLRPPCLLCSPHQTWSCSWTARYLTLVSSVMCTLFMGGATYVVSFHILPICDYRIRRSARETSPMAVFPVLLWSSCVSHTQSPSTCPCCVRAWYWFSGQYMQYWTFCFYSACCFSHFSLDVGNNRVIWSNPPSGNNIRSLLYLSVRRHTQMHSSHVDLGAWCCDVTCWASWNRYVPAYCRQLLHDRGRNVFFQDMIVLLSVSVNYLENLLFLKLPSCLHICACTHGFLKALLLIFVLTVLGVSCGVILWQDVYFCILLLYFRACVTHLTVYL